MIRYFRLTGAIAVVVFVPMLAFVRHMEALNRFDSIGWPYSVYVSIAFSLPLALVAAGLYLVITKHRGADHG